MMSMHIATHVVRYALLLLFVVWTLTGCDSQPEKTPPTKLVKTEQKQTPSSAEERPLHSKELLNEPVKAHLIESPEMALPVFQDTVKKKPVLVLMANNPLLAPLPPSGKERVMALMTGARDTLTQAVAPFQTNPALLPNMTISAALAGDYFSRVLWVVPTTAEKELFSGTKIKQQLLQFGAIDESEALSFQDNATDTVAVIRNVPWQIVRYTDIPKMGEPVVVYLDMDFFQPLYKGEIKTPLLEIYSALLNDLKGKSLRTFNVVLCRNNLNGLPLETRFLAADLATAFGSPQILDGEPPTEWQQRKNALYLENFMQSEKIDKVYREMLKNNPDDPSIKFALYQSSRRLKRVDEALELLAQAVATDRYYGLEYLNLAEVAAKKNLPRKQIDMFDRASAAFPDNPFLDIEKVRLLASMNHSEQARFLAEKLLKMEWSPLYFKDMEKYLNDLLAKSSNDKDMK